MQSIGLAIDSDSLREYEARRSRETKAEAQRRELDELVRKSPMPPAQAPPALSREHAREEINRPDPWMEKARELWATPEGREQSELRQAEAMQRDLDQRPEQQPELKPQQQPARETFLERKRREARERGEIEPEFGSMPSKPRILEMEYRPRKRRDDEPHNRH